MFEIEGRQANEGDLIYLVGPGARDPSIMLDGVKVNLSELSWRIKSTTGGATVRAVDADALRRHVNFYEHDDAGAGEYVSSTIFAVVDVKDQALADWHCGVVEIINEGREKTARATGAGHVLFEPMPDVVYLHSDGVFREAQPSEDEVANEPEPVADTSSEEAPEVDEAPPQSIDFEEDDLDEELEALREQYRNATGSEPDGRWKKASLESKIAELTAEAETE